MTPPESSPATVDRRAIRNAALEEAARVAEEYKRREYGPHGTEWVSCEEAEQIAREIRDLMEGE